jgi:hypothetical protein
MADFSKLPDKLIHIIFDYANIVVFRYGKYMDRFNKLDYRYNIISNIPKPIWIGNHRYMIKHVIKNLIETKYLLYINIYNTNNNQYYLTRTTVIKHDDGCLETVEQKQYIFDQQGKYYQTVNYTM